MSDDRPLIKHWPKVSHSLPLRWSCGGTFLESGLIQIGEFTGQPKYSDLPSTHHYGAKLRQYIAGGGTGLGEDGAALLLDKVSAGAHGMSGPKSITTLPYPSQAFPAKSQGKKLIAANFPPSLFSGKLRLFIQAQYGAKNNDTFPFSTDELQLNLYCWGRRLDSVCLYSNGLYTDSVGNYWLITITPAGVAAAPLRLSASGKAFQRALRDLTLGPDDRTRVEAYILADATIGEDVLINVDVKPLYQRGAAFYYGWRFNWRGNRADICVHQVDPEHMDAAHYRWLWSRAHLDLSDDGAGHLSAGLLIDENRVPGMMSPGYTRIWTPALFGCGMVVWLPSPYLDAPEIFDCDVPIDCYYDAEDALVITRYSVSGIGSHTGQFTGMGGYLCGESGCLVDTYTYTSKSRGGFFNTKADARADSGDLIMRGWQHFARKDYSGRVESDSESYPLRSPLQADVDVCSPYYTDANCAPGPSATYSCTWAYSLYDVHLGYFNGMLGMTALCVLPKANCEAIYIGFWNEYSGQISSYGYYDVEMPDVWLHATGDGGCIRLDGEFRIPQGFNRQDTHDYGFIAAIQGGRSFQPPGGIVIDKIQIDLCHRRGHQRVFKKVFHNFADMDEALAWVPEEGCDAIEIPSEEVLDDTLEWKGWYIYFNVPLMLDPCSYSSLYVQESLFGDLRYQETPDPFSVKFVSGYPVTGGPTIFEGHA